MSGGVKLNLSSALPWSRAGKRGDWSCWCKLECGAEIEYQRAGPAGWPGGWRHRFGKVVHHVLIVHCPAWLTGATCELLLLFFSFHFSFFFWTWPVAGLLRALMNFPSLLLNCTGANSTLWSFEKSCFQPPVVKLSGETAEQDTKQGT